MRKSRGPKILPCGTPDRTGRDDEFIIIIESVDSISRDDPDMPYI